MPMPAIHRDFIAACQMRKATLRNLLRDVREAEVNVRRWPELRSMQRTLAFREDQLAEFMYRNCGFVKGEPAPARKWRMPSAAESQREYAELVLSIPLGRSNVEPRA
jgi:hypothetical protein